MLNDPLDNLACCLVWEMSSVNMALLFTIIFMSKQPLRPECLHFYVVWLESPWGWFSQSLRSPYPFIKARGSLPLLLVYFLTASYASLTVKKIIDEDPFYNTKILIFSFTWAGLAVFHKSSTIWWRLFKVKLFDFQKYNNWVSTTTSKDILLLLCNKCF